MKLYHQAGFRSNWSIDSYQNDSVGDGIIFSPVHETKEKLIEKDVQLKSHSLFDPQFYIPDSQKSKLQTYDFFPEVITGDGFKTIDFETVAFESAEKCVDFQLEQGFQALIIPTRFFSDVKSDFTNQQEVFTVSPFLDTIKRRGVKKDIFLTLPMIHSIMIDEGFKNDILNWVTSFPEITGIYVMCDHSENAKQVQDFSKLWGYIDFIRKLQNAKLKVIVGYSNTEALLYTALAPYAVTVGAYENTRMFSIDKFLENESDRRGPKPRLYIPKLLNWIRLNTLIEIKEDNPALWQKIYTPTKYSEDFITKTNPHFANQEPYKHYFLSFGNQFNDLKALPIDLRIDSLIQSVKTANSLYDEIRQNGIEFFNRDCENDHLEVWLRVLKKLKTP